MSPMLDGFGGGKSSDGWPASARSMYSFQMGAGMLAPKTTPGHTEFPDRVLPHTLVIGTLPMGEPIHTTVVSCGVNPSNQALSLFSAVPVLPQPGRPARSLP